MKFHWRTDDGPALKAGLVALSNYAKKPYIFYFRGGGGGSAHDIDENIHRQYVEEYISRIPFVAPDGVVCQLSPSVRNRACSVLVL